MDARSVIVLVRDLLFKSKIESVASAAGVQTYSASSLEEVHKLLEEVNAGLAIVDLSDSMFPASEVARIVKGLQPHVTLVGFASHVELKTLRSAQEAGFERVMSRSEFTAKLPSLMSDLANAC